MEIITDLGDEAAGFFGMPAARIVHTLPNPPSDGRSLFEALFGGKRLQRVLLPEKNLPRGFPLVCVIAKSPRSNLDTLSELLRAGVCLPDGLVCAAVEGEGFLGRHDRTWRVERGNLHAVIRLKPDMKAEKAGPSFSFLAALALVDAIRARPGLSPPPRIKWINDVLVEDRKIAGLLTRQTFQDPCISDVLLGIGVNVLSDPGIPENPFVRGSGCLARLYPQKGWSPGGVLLDLLKALKRSYDLLIKEGFSPMMERYRTSSNVKGREVRIFQDGFGFPEDGLEGRELIARGRVEEILDDLSLRIRGASRPVAKGRLVFEEDASRDRVRRLDPFVQNPPDRLRDLS